jgi:hypothetical protein
MIMSMAKIIAFPLLSLLALLYLWCANLVTIKNVWIIAAVVNIIYVTMQLYRYGILFMKPSIAEIKCPEFTFYYKEFDGKYCDAREKLVKPFSECDGNMVKSEYQVDYLEIYTDKVDKSKCQSSGHIIAGFALRGAAAIDIGVRKVLECHNFKKTDIKPCEAIVGTIKKIDNYSGGIVVHKLSGHVRNYLESKYKESGMLFMWEQKKTVTCGVFYGQSKKQFEMKEQFGGKSELSDTNIKLKGN